VGGGGNGESKSVAELKCVLGWREKKVGKKKAFGIASKLLSKGLQGV